MKLIGKLTFEAVCPLCTTIYELDYHEVRKGVNSNKYFINCKVCERGIYIDPDDRRMFRYIYDYEED